DSGVPQASLSLRRPRSGSHGRFRHSCTSHHGGIRSAAPRVTDGFPFAIQQPVVYCKRTDGGVLLSGQAGGFIMDRDKPSATAWGITTSQTVSTHKHAIPK